MVEHLLHDLLQYFIKDKLFPDAPFDGVSFCECFNYYSRMIARIYPFRLMVIEALLDNASGPYVLSIDSQNFYFKVSLEKNPFFTESIIGTFITFDNIKNVVMRAERYSKF